MSSKKKRKMKEELFGSIRLEPSIGRYAVDPKDLSAAMEWDQAAARVFCTKCAEPIEVDAVLAKKLAEEAGQSALGTFEGMYFEVSGCILCSGGYRHPSLKIIKSIQGVLS